MTQSQSLIVLGAEISPNIQAVILTSVIAIVGWIINARPKLHFGPINNAFFVHTIKDEEDETKEKSITIYTNKFFVQNTGLAPAKNIEILLNGDGSQIRVWPAIDYTLKQNRDGFYIIEISRILGGELIVIDTLNVNGGKLFVAGVRSDEIIGKEAHFYAERMRGKFFFAFVTALFILGVFSLVEWAVWLLKRLAGA